jgi:hypothetical protein
MNFADLLKKTAAYLSSKAKEAVDWYKQKILKIGNSSSLKDPDNVFKKVSYPEVGKMFIYYYDPKYQKQLPFWDTYPLVIPIEPITISKTDGAGFLGINLHYIPPLQRAALLQSLMDLRNNDKYDNTTKLNISYSLLKAYSSRYAGYEECVKRYLLGHIRSSLHEINFNDWDKVVMLPLQKWTINPNRRIAGRPPY